jgi:hypothetical protein
VQLAALGTQPQRQKVVGFGAQDLAPALQAAYRKLHAAAEGVARDDGRYAGNSPHLRQRLVGDNVLRRALTTAHVVRPEVFTGIGIDLDQGQVTDAPQLFGGVALQAHAQGDENDDSGRADDYTHGRQRHACFAARQVFQDQGDQVQGFHPRP